MSNAPRNYPPAFYRYRARKALKGHWLTALQIALIVSLLPWLVRGIFNSTSGEALRSLAQLVNSAALLEGTIPTQAATQFLQDYGPRLSLFAGLELAAYLIIPCLTLGMDKWMMDRLRGEDGPVTAVFCRVRLFFKACGLQIYIALKILLWMLPGFCLTFLLTYLFSAGGTSSSGFLTLLKAYIVSLLPFSMIVPGFLAYVRYSLSEYILADNPGMKIRACVSRSKQLVRNNMRFIIMNVLFFLLLLFLISMLIGLPEILYYVLTLFLSLVITAYWTGTLAAVYLHLEFGAEQKEEQEAAPDPGPEEIN